MQGGVGGKEQNAAKKPEGHGKQDEILGITKMLLMKLAQPGQHPHWQSQTNEEEDGGGKLVEEEMTEDEEI
jgi:hypothetical protein